VAGFEHRVDAERFRREVDSRLKTFGLALHENKTRLIEFGRFARESRRRRGQGKTRDLRLPGLHALLRQDQEGQVHGLADHQCQTAAVQAARREGRIAKAHAPTDRRAGPVLRSVVSGHTRYFGVPATGARIGMFRLQVSRMWHRTLCRRSQAKHLSWRRMRKIVAHWLPSPRICHPYPNQRLIVTTREPCAVAPHARRSVEGVLGDWHSYSDFRESAARLRTRASACASKRARPTSQRLSMNSRSVATPSLSGRTGCGCRSTRIGPDPHRPAP
jgi:hypothetical protein